MSQFVDNSARGMSLVDYDDECFKAGPCPIIYHMRHSAPAAQAHHRRMLNAMRGSSPVPFDLAVRLKTFDSDAADPCPQLAGESGGRWVVKSGEAGKRAPVLSLGLAPCDQEFEGSPRVKVIPQVSRKLVLESRDKEMLLEQILDLKRCLFDQQIHMRHYKIQASMLDMENRRMHRDILDMEKPNCQSRATRLSHCMRMRARIFGLKNKLLDMQGIAESQDDEIHKLREDSRVSHCREIEFERDVFLGEVGRLKGQIQKLKVSHNELMSTNQELQPYADKAAEAEADNDHLELEKEGLENDMDKVNKELKIVRSAAAKAEIEAKDMDKIFKAQEHKYHALQASLERTRADIPKLKKLLEKETQEFKIHKKDVKKGRKKINIFN